jgi:hypothetical protein
MARHQRLNDLIWHALCQAGIPAIKEPSGLLRSDGKRPDGLTLIACLRGKPLTWDVTITDTVAISYLSLSSVISGGAAEQAADRKTLKYVHLTFPHIFQPLAFETFGPINSSAVSFLSELGNRLTAQLGDMRESSFLFQRLLTAIQRFNGVAFRGSFVTSADLGS